MENFIQKFRQTSTVCTHFLLSNVYKRVRGIFLILFRSWVTCRNKKRPCFYTLVFYIFISNSRPKQNKKNPEHPFLDIIKQKTCAKFLQEILNSMVVGARQSFQFFRQKNLVSWK